MAATISAAFGGDVEVRPDESLADAVAQNPDRIVLKPGVHRLSETVVLSFKNRGLIIEAENSADATFISGAHLVQDDSWQPHPRIEGAWRATIPRGFPHLKTVFLNKAILPRARSKGFRQLATPPENAEFVGRRAIDQQHAYLPLAARENFHDIRDAELRIIPKFPWVCHLLPVTTLNRKTGLVYSRVPGTYPMTPPAFGHFPNNHTAWIENSIDVLDQPGEWVFHSETRELILKTPDGKPPGNRVEIPALTELIRIEGRQNEFDFEDQPVTGITFRNIRFTGANAYSWPEGKTGLGLQHDWEMHDAPSAMVRLRFAEACRFENCRFVNSGATGLRMDLHCRKNIVRGCEFANLGGAGIVLAGYGLGFKDVNRENLITDNNIHHIGQHWWHAPAIFAWQSGRNRIIHNHIHHVPHNAITISGRTQIDVSGLKESSRTARMDEVLFHLEGKKRTWENREPLMHGRYNDIAWNDIHHAMELMADGNAIYISGTGTGNRVHHNFIHDIVGPNMNGTIRCDDDQHEVRIDFNLIVRCAGEGFLWKGRCDIENNIVYALRMKAENGVQTQHRRGFLVLGGAPVTGSNVIRNLFVSKNPGYPILFERPKPWLKHGKIPMPAVRLADANSDFNWFWNESNPHWANSFFEKQRPLGIEKNSVFGDPEFADPAKNDFTIRQGMFVEQTGFVRFDVETAGPRHGAWRFENKDTETDFNLENSELNPTELGEISAAFPKIEWLNLYRTKIGDAGARVVGEMRTLTHLPIGESGVTDEGLTHFSELRNLQYLGLRGNAVTSAGLQSLEDLSQLKELNLAQTNVEDEGVKFVSETFDLEKLWLHDTRITNQALEFLTGMKSLKKLYLQRTNTTVGEIKALRTALPKCNIFWESDE